MVIVFPLLQGLVDLSFPPQAVDVIEEQRGFGVVRRGLKRLHHQWSLQMAAHAQTSQPQALAQLQHNMLILKQPGPQLTNQTVSN